MTRRICTFGLALTVFIASCAPRSEGAEYAAKVGFTRGGAVKFPDFVLTYIGERHVASDRFPRGFTFHDFKVAAPPAPQTVSWSSGTGDIGPAMFRVGAKKFALELRRSDKLGPLKAKELVITRAP